MKTKVTRSILLASILFCLFYFSGCSNGPAEEKTETTEVVRNSERNELEGAWEVVWTKSNGQVDQKQKPTQIKIFSDGYFSLIMQDSLGKWTQASAGTYETDGKVYKETHLYSNIPEWVGLIDWQEFEIRGDTLVNKLFTKIINGNGEDVTAQYPKMEEKRVRPKMKLID
jgi:hypothetical protein